MELGQGGAQPVGCGIIHSTLNYAYVCRPIFQPQSMQAGLDFYKLIFMEQVEKLTEEKEEFIV